MSTREPKQSRGQETKEKIKKAGLKLFSENGYFHINSKDIAKEAGVSIGSFYSYFKDKKILFIELLKDFKKNKFETVYTCNPATEEEICAREGDIAFFKEGIRGYVKNIIESSINYPPEFYMEILHLSFRDEDIKSEYELYVQEEVDMLMEIFTDMPMNLNDKKRLHISTVIQKLIDSYVLVILKENNEDIRNSIIRSFEEGIFVVVEEQLQECN